MSLHSLAVSTAGVYRHDPTLCNLCRYSVAVLGGAVSGFHALRAMMQRNQYDACVTCPGSLAAISQHGYNYSMAIGDACKVTVRKRRRDTFHGWRYVGGSVYNYGIGKANYPVPAIKRSWFYLDGWRYLPTNR